MVWLEETHLVKVVKVELKLPVALEVLLGLEHLRAVLQVLLDKVDSVDFGKRLLAAAAAAVFLAAVAAVMTDVVLEETAAAAAVADLV
jgi:hypothetical protein